MSNIQTVGSNNFATRVIRAKAPVLVDFYADWCGPCNAQTPVLESLAQAQGSDLAVVKVDVDQEPELARQYGVRGIPTLILFRNGTASATRTGVSTQAQLTQWIEQSDKNAD